VNFILKKIQILDTQVRKEKKENACKPFHRHPLFDASYLDTWKTPVELICPIHGFQHNKYFSILQNHKPTCQKGNGQYVNTRLNYNNLKETMQA